MDKNKKVDLMMTKEQIMLAVDQSVRVKEKYYEYWLFTEMLQEINKELMNGNMELLDGEHNE